MELLYAVTRGRAMGKIRAEQVSVTPQVSGGDTQLNIKDNQFVNAGTFSLCH